MKPSEQKIYGKNACLAFAKLHPTKVIRAYCTEEQRGRLGVLLKYLASQKRAYHIVSDEDLNKISESEHHEGICLLIERIQPGTEEDLLAELIHQRKNPNQLLLCLDGISNPHNLGAISRTAAHFGIKNIFLCHIETDAQKALVSGAYHRTSEGGSVHVNLFCSTHGHKLLEKLKRDYGWKILATSSHGRTQFLNKTKFPPKCALVMGSEANGISSELLTLADERVCINGTGHVESLNVACATAILLNHYRLESGHQRDSLSPKGAMPTRAVRADGRKRNGS